MTDEEREIWAGDRIAAMRRRNASLTEAQVRRILDDVLAQIVILATDLDARDWSADLHPADVIEKHIARAIDL